MSWWEISIVTTLAGFGGAITERILATRKTHICANCFLRKAANEFHKPLFEVFHWPDKGPIGIRVFAGVNWGVTLREGTQYAIRRIKEKIMPGVRQRIRR